LARSTGTACAPGSIASTRRAAAAESLQRERARAGAAVDDDESVHALPEPVEQRPA